MAQSWWKPTWSVPAAMRAVRATIVIPALFALTYKVIGDPQMALFATFGGFATLVITGFGGTQERQARRPPRAGHHGQPRADDRDAGQRRHLAGGPRHHPGMFAIFFAGVLGPTAASGSTARVRLRAACRLGGRRRHDPQPPGGLVAGLRGGHPRRPAALPPVAGRPAPGGRGGALAKRRTRQRRRQRPAHRPADMRAAKERLRAAFTGAPFRPTGLATADQALDSLVQLLDWGTAQVSDAFDGHVDMAMACSADRTLLRSRPACSRMLTLLSGAEAVPASTRWSGRGPTPRHT